MLAAPGVLGVNVEFFALRCQIPARPNLPAAVGGRRSPLALAQPVGKALSVLSHLVLRQRDVQAEVRLLQHELSTVYSILVVEMDKTAPRIPLPPPAGQPGVGGVLVSAPDRLCPLSMPTALLRVEVSLITAKLRTR